jgi:UDP-N-acetylmuramoyl-tripeptide--D-alanyl-D-alanine ligase
LDLSLKEIADVTGGLIVAGGPGTKFAAFHHHSDDAKPGSFFFALKGARVDGHDYLRAAYSAGCRGAIVTDRRKFDSLRDGMPGMCAVLVDDAVEALASLGREVIRRLHPRIIGITGSVGKTTTKEMAAAMLGGKYAVGYSPGNLNTEIGLPIALLNFNGDEEIVVLEMATRGFGQIAHLCGIAPPDVAVITNAGHSHIECFGDINGVRRAKIEIVENTAEGGAAIVYGDDSTLAGMAAGTGKQIIAFGETGRCDFRIADISVDAEGVSFSLRHRGEAYSASIRPGSRGDAFNCAAATAVAHTLGVGIRDALDAVRSFKPTELRLERRIGPNSSLLLVDCYNANPESMRNAVEATVASRREGGRVIGVLADMLELGELSQKEHSALGIHLGEKGFDLLLTYGNEIKITAREFKEKGGVSFHFERHEDIADWLRDNAAGNDVILLKGSRLMALEKVLEYLGI